MATGDSRNADVLVRILREGSPKPTIFALFDGDPGGKERQKKFKPLLIGHRIDCDTLLSGTTIEDHLPLLEELYVPAVAKYVGDVLATTGNPPENPSELERRFVLSFKERFNAKVTAGVADWASKASQDLTGLEGPSRVGIAREYVQRLAGASPSRFAGPSLNRAVKLMEQVKKGLGLPALREPSAAISRDSN